MFLSLETKPYFNLFISLNWCYAEKIHYVNILYVKKFDLSKCIKNTHLLTTCKIDVKKKKSIFENKYYKLGHFQFTSSVLFQIKQKFVLILQKTFNIRIFLIK